MVFSTKKKHIDENLTSTNFEMSDADYKRLTDFRPDNYNPPPVDWEGTGIEDDIVMLGKDFDTHRNGSSVRSSVSTQCISLTILSE